MKHFKPENDVKMEGRRLNFLEILNNSSIRNDYDRILNKKNFANELYFWSQCGKILHRTCTKLRYRFTAAEGADRQEKDVRHSRIFFNKNLLCTIAVNFRRDARTKCLAVCNQLRRFWRIIDTHS